MLDQTSRSQTVRATFLNGGVPSPVSLRGESLVLSILRFDTVLFDSGVGGADCLTSNFRPEVVARGGVDRKECTSGVPERLRCTSSVRRRAARVFVETTASAWHVAWYTCNKR